MFLNNTKLKTSIVYIIFCVFLLCSTLVLGKEPSCQVMAQEGLKLFIEKYGEEKFSPSKKKEIYKKIVLKCESKFNKVKQGKTAYQQSQPTQKCFDLVYKTNKALESKADSSKGRVRNKHFATVIVMQCELLKILKKYLEQLESHNYLENLNLAIRESQKFTNKSLMVSGMLVAKISQSLERLKKQKIITELDASKLLISSTLTIHESYRVKNLLYWNWVPLTPKEEKELLEHFEDMKKMHTDYLKSFKKLTKKMMDKFETNIKSKTPISTESLNDLYSFRIRLEKIEREIEGHNNQIFWWN